MAFQQTFREIWATATLPGKVIIVAGVIGFIVVMGLIIIHAKKY